MAGHFAIGPKGRKFSLPIRFVLSFALYLSLKKKGELREAACRAPVADYNDREIMRKAVGRFGPLSDLRLVGRR